MKTPREIRVTNTSTRKKETLQPRTPGKLTMYSCGPTVYGLIHIGNLRAALVADMFARYFRYAGYELTYVRNYTDVDDKIINKANDQGVTSDVIAKQFTTEVEKDYAVAGLIEPDHKTKATEHIPEMISTIEKIIANGAGYVVEGEVLFAIEKFPTYGKLSHKNLDDLIAGARVEVSAKKRNPMDFTLWKPAKPGEPSWDSPWGKGRPGWHIECSAMASKWLGDQIDVHHGGIDLIFPHHENEIAQSEAASGKDPFCRYWLHSAHLTLSKEKMSKSIGNVFLARDFLTQFSGEFARYMLLSVHYRSELDFGEDAIDNTMSALTRIYEAKAKAQELMGKKAKMPDQRAEALWGSFVAECEKVRREIDEHMANDFNTPAAIASVFNLIREFNKTLAEPLAAATPSCVLGAGQFIEVLEKDLGAILGVGRGEPGKVLGDLDRIRAQRSGVDASARLATEEIERLLAERLVARKAKDFARSDAIRDELAAQGIDIKDSPQGTTWKYR
ncbi:MAG: cysteine--tRNA ligase [Bacteriovoracia bacterium]